MKPARLTKGALTGIQALVLVLVVAALSLLLFSSLCACGGQGTARKAASMSHLKQQALAHELYMGEWDGFGPRPDVWMDSLVQYTGNDRIFRLQHESIQKDEYGYAYNQALFGQDLRAVANSEQAVVTFESSRKIRNANGGAELLMKESYWAGEVYMFSFLDGHVALLKNPPSFTVPSSKKDSGRD